MTIDGWIEGRFVRLRSITEHDAEFSFSIRNSKHASGLVGVKVESVDDQREYIRKQRKKEGDYYFVVTNMKEEPIGLIGVYDINGDEAEIGREVSIGNPAEMLEPGILIAEFSLNYLKLRNLRFIVYKKNTKHIMSLKQEGLIPTEEIIHSGEPSLIYRVDLYNSAVSEKRKRLLDVYMRINK